MACAQADSVRSPAFRSVPFVELRQSLPSQIAIISPFVDQLMHFIAKFRNPDGSELNIETALREALANAIMHGNHEDPRKIVCVACRCTTDGDVSLTVQDEGQGFDTAAVLDPTTPENRLLPHGRGIYLMKTLMDDALRIYTTAPPCSKQTSPTRDQGQRENRHDPIARMTSCVVPS
jgi:serine/threonine-protein kinase RsbW